MKFVRPGAGARASNLVGRALGSLILKTVSIRLRYQRSRNVRRGKNRFDASVQNTGETTDGYQALISGAGSVRLNIGCGRKNLAGFIGIDFIDAPRSNYLRANALDLRFIPSSSVDQIHSNQFVEHLTPDQAQHFFGECNRVLADEGLLSVRCPNALGATYAFLLEGEVEQHPDQFIADGFPPDEALANQLDLHIHGNLWRWAHWMWGDPGNASNQHLQQYTPTSLVRQLEHAGFTVKRMSQPESVQLVVLAVPSQESLSEST